MQFDQLNRREVITLIGGAAAAWPLAARAAVGRRWPQSGSSTVMLDENERRRTLIGQHN